MVIRVDSGLVVQQLSGRSARSFVLSDVDPGASVVRHLVPDEDARRRLGEQGFVVKPSRVAWMVDIGVDDEEFLAGFSARHRREIRRTQRLFGKSGFELQVDSFSAGAVSDSFVELYHQTIASRSLGIDALSGSLRSLYADPTATVIRAVRPNGEVGGYCVVRAIAGTDILRLCYSAVEPKARRFEMSRNLYIEAFRLARRSGLERATLGADPNLYGHIVDTGLLRFKASLGARPVPAGSVDPVDLGDEAELIVAQGVLADPTVTFAYAADGGTQLVPIVFTSNALSVAEFSTSVGPIEVRRWGVSAPRA